MTFISLIVLISDLKLYQVSLVVCLVELLLLLSACCFADHIRKLQRGDSEKANSEKEGIIDSNEEAYSIHHEESKSICFKYICEGGGGGVGLGSFGKLEGDSWKEIRKKQFPKKKELSIAMKKLIVLTMKKVSHFCFVK
jgi:hypothetical protein